MAPTTATTQLRRAIAGLRNKSGLAYDIAKSLMSFDDAQAFFVEMYDVARMVDDMVSAASDRLIELTKCNCEPDERGYHQPYCAMQRRWKPIPLPGSGILKFGGGGERTRFDQEKTVGRFAKAIAERAWTEAQLVTVVGDGGEDATPRWEQIVHGIASWMAEATGATAPSFTGWRTGVARRLRISLEGLSDKEPRPVTVRVEGRARE